MKFYNREKELEQLNAIRERSAVSSQMTFIVGRRRIGKTTLLKVANTNSTFLYFFIAKKNEALLCQEFTEEIQQKLGIEVYGTLRTFKNIFSYVMELSKSHNLTVVIDEFQEFYSVNPAIYSEMQNIWDAKKNDANINLVLCGSIYSLMKKIFEQAKEPLFGRATARIHLKAFDIPTLKEILSDYNPGHTPDDLLLFYIVTGGVAKYVEMLVNQGKFSFEPILDNFFEENSLFLNEGKNVLIDEFGKDYGNYFSILSLIASSKTTRPDIESVLEIQTGGFLDKLENEYGIIEKVRPILAKPNSRKVKYKIKDNFLHFWFRFVYKYRSAIELGNSDYIKQIVARDYTSYSGILLEKYFTEKLIHSQQYSVIGSYWEKQNQNEIDIVAINDMKKQVLIAEVKRKKENINLKILEQKAATLIQQFNGYQIEYKGFSLTDM